MLNCWRPSCGLSPRVRGKPRVDGDNLRYEGSIPACAGEAVVGGKAHHNGGVYPRVCGGSIAKALPPW